MNLFRYKRVSILILTVLLLPYSGNSLSRFRKVPQEKYYVKQGEDIEIPCVADIFNATCSWLLNGTVDYYKVSENGDCSLKLTNVSVDRNDGVYECQVLTSHSGGARYNSNWPNATLIVMVKPNPPKLEEESFQDGVPAGQKKSLICVSSGGNPLPSLEWYLDGENITASANTTVKSEKIFSTLDYVFAKKDNGASLTCKSVHRLETQTTKKKLNVTYRPIVSVDRRVFTMHENHNLTIECQVDANPPSQAIWKPTDLSMKSYSTSGNKLILTEVKGKAMDGKEFQCTSKNAISGSEVATVIISVLHPPRIGIKAQTPPNVLVGGELELLCEAHGNPKPTITWHFIDSINKKDHPLAPDDPSKLVVRNVSYLDEGVYFCEATNKIEDTITKNISEGIVVNVTGRPQFLSPNEPVIGYQNSFTRIEAVFCSDPFPTSLKWTYGGVEHNINLDPRKKTELNFSEVEDGTHIKASPLVPFGENISPNHSCFITALSIFNTDISDAKEFTVTVKNNNGTVEKVIHFQVSNKMSGAMIITISLIVLLMLFALTILFIFFLRRRSSDHQGPDDYEDKSDSHVPIHTTDDAAKQATTEKVL